MDSALRCNSLQCRVHLTERAVVTTCSHIFCLPCSKALHLIDDRSGGCNVRTCPACQTSLTNPDDVVDTSLSPSEDYKTSVLAGLGPNVIMDCAGRGLSFWSYQVSQEITYQEHLTRNLTEKYTVLSTQMDKIIHDANAEITSLRGRVSSLHVEHEKLNEKNRELVNSLREKTKTHQMLQRLYEAMKRKQAAAGMEFAAENEAEYVVQTAAGGGRDLPYENHATRAGDSPSNRVRSNGSGRGHGGVRTWDGQAHGGRYGLQTSRSAPVVQAPPTHRVRIPPPLPQNDRGIYRGTTGNGHTGVHDTTHRQPLNDINPNVSAGHSHSSGFGTSAGIKMTRQHNGLNTRNAVPSSRMEGVVGLNGR